MAYRKKHKKPRSRAFPKYSVLNKLTDEELKEEAKIFLREFYIIAKERRIMRRKMLKYFKTLYDRGLTPKSTAINGYFRGGGPGRFFGCDDEFLDNLVGLVGTFEGRKVVKSIDDAGVTFDERVEDDCTKDNNSWMRNFRKQSILPSISKKSGRSKYQTNKLDR